MLLTTEPSSPGTDALAPHQYLGLVVQATVLTVSLKKWSEGEASQ